MSSGHITLKGHTDQITSVTFSPDGKRLASASLDRTLKVWDAENGKEIRALNGHTNRVESVPFSPDGTRLASASFDGKGKVWDAATGLDILTLKATPASSRAWHSARLAPGSPPPVRTER